MSNMQAARNPNDRGLVDPGYCLEFSRSIGNNFKANHGNNAELDCVFVAFCEERMVKRDQLNGNTAFIDNSNVYGNEFGVYKKLRLFRHGLMKASQQGQNMPLQGNRLVYIVGTIMMMRWTYLT